MSGEPTLSRRARKKLAREVTGQTQVPASSESVTSDTTKKDDLLATSTLPESDGELKIRDGLNPFIDILQKKDRNLSKRRTRLEGLEAQQNDPMMPDLKPDQIEALSHLPKVAAVINELAELVAAFKKIEQSENEILVSQYRKYKEDLRDAERAKEIAVKEAHERGVAEGRGESKLLASFLKYASYLRGTPSNSMDENHAAEDVLIGVYQGGEKGAAVAQKLAEASDEVVGEDTTWSYADVKEAVLKFEDPTKGEVGESQSEQLNGSYIHIDEPAANGSPEYQIPLSEATALDDSHYPKDSITDNGNPNHIDTTGVNFFQTSELEHDVYPTTPHGFPMQGISFLQESELGANQPHEEYTNDERPEEVVPSEQLPPTQTLTESEGPPKVNLGVSALPGAETGEAGYATAAEKMSKTPSLQGQRNTESKTDWAEEVSPTNETAPTLPDKKKEEDEWTTQGSRHSRHQPQQRGGRGTQRGGWRGGEGRGGGRGGHRGGRGGERGSSNGERRGPWRGGGERGRGRGGNSLPPTAV